MSENENIKSDNQSAAPAEESMKEIRARVALEFAKALAKQTVYEPNKSASRTTQVYSLYTKEQILQWLKNPASNEANLRKASCYLYMSSLPYQRLIDWYAGLLLWAYVISPLAFDSGKVKADQFRKQYVKISQQIENMNVKEEMGKALTAVLREGVFYGIIWSDNTSFFMQKINPDYCTITAISDGGFLYSIDMSRFKEEQLPYYPPEFTTMWNTYQSTGEKYQEVPPEISFCLKADPSVAEYSVPPFAAVLPSLYTIANIESLQESAEELQNYKLLSLEMELDDEGIPLMEWDMAMQYYQHIANALPPQVGAALCPFPIKEHNFEKSAGVADVDTVSRALSNFWATAGSPSVLHGISNNTAGVTSLHIKGETALVYKIMYQAERLINRRLKLQGGSVKFKLTFLPVTVYNQDEMANMYKAAASFGVGVSFYAATIGVPQNDLEGLAYLENDVLGLPKILRPLSNAYTGGADGEAGRPAKKDGDLTADGEGTRASGANDNR